MSNNTNNDDLIFMEEEDGETSEKINFWNLLIVDDDPEVLSVTRMALGDIEYKNLGISTTNATSMLEAKEILDMKVPFSAIILDVMMEEDDSGFQLVNYIRNMVNDKFVRIVMRTGQPGSMPENEILEYFDISAYYVKTELTSSLLRSVVLQQLRDYEKLAYFVDEIHELKKKLDDNGINGYQIPHELEMPMSCLKGYMSRLRKNRT